MKKVLSILGMVMLCIQMAFAQDAQTIELSAISGNDLQATDEVSDADGEENAHVRLIYSNTFKDGDKGLYGIGFDVLWSRVNLSFSCHANYGLVDSDYAGILFALGPNANAKLSNACTFVCPLKVTLATSSHEDSEVVAGLMLDPYISLGSESFKIFVGPQFTISFQSGAEPNIGLSAGFAF